MLTQAQFVGKCFRMAAMDCTFSLADRIQMDVESGEITKATAEAVKQDYAEVKDFYASKVSDGQIVGAMLQRANARN